ncbi:hypothetical protein [Microbacterium sp. ANT_H45B]
MKISRATVYRYLSAS